MNKLIISSMFFFASLSIGFSQSTNSFFLEGGGAYTSFQDLKFSSVSFSGLGGAFKFGYEKDTENYIWNLRFGGNVGKERPNTHKVTSSLTFNPKFQFRYLKKINNQLSVGVQWNMLGLYFRQVSGLMNNSITYLASSDLMAAATYQVGKFNFGLDLGLLSFQKELTGFAFSAPQVGLENGEFDYQNENLSNPFGFEYYTLAPLGKQLILQTHIAYQLSNRLSIGYYWNTRHFATVNKYSTTIGNHQVLLRYNLIYKTKDSTIEK